MGTNGTNDRPGDPSIGPWTLGKRSLRSYHEGSGTTEKQETSVQNRGIGVVSVPQSTSPAAGLGILSLRVTIDLMRVLKRARALLPSRAKRLERFDYFTPGQWAAFTEVLDKVVLKTCSVSLPTVGGSCSWSTRKTVHLVISFWTL